MNTTPHYDLLPLAWWENPWTIGLIMLGVSMAMISIYVIMRIMKSRTASATDPLNQWLFDLHTLQKVIASDQYTTQRAYHELMRIIREYAHIHYMIYDASHTDEEFIYDLKNTTLPVSQHFLDIVEKINIDAYQVKFAKIIFPADHIQNYVQDLILFLEQEKMKLQNFSSK